VPGIEEVIEKTSGKVQVFETAGGDDTIAVGRKVAVLLKPSQLLILRGDLGAGKTTLVKGIAEGLNAAAAEEVTSPTFTLIHEFEGEYRMNGKTTPVTLYHLDLYRIEGERQLESLGIEELVRPDSIVLVEWGEKFSSIVKRSDGEIVVESLGGDARRITLQLQ
jgi:tRNA threonylcarbamoyladenosine biosynthesis protein TsaE